MKNKKKTTQRKTMKQINMKDDELPCLPKEILLNIISRLPLSKILQFQYHGITTAASISNPLFAQLYHSNHHTTTRGHSHGFFLAYEPHHRDNTFLVEYLPTQNQTLTTHLNMEFLGPQERPSSSYTVLNSCNGWLLVRCLLLRRDNDKPRHVVDSFLVVNPVTCCRFLLSLVPENLNLRFPDCDELYGLGFSAKTGQYKVVRFVVHCGDDDYYSVEVLTLEGCTSEWRRLNHLSKMMTIGEYGLLSVSPVAWSSGLHWLIRAHNRILRFDLDNEALEFFPTPPYSHVNCGNFVSNVGMVAGKASSWLYVSVFNIKRHDVEIWVIKEYYGCRRVEESWTRLTIMHGLNYPLQISFNLIRLIEDDSDDHGGTILVLFQNGVNKLVRYDLNTMKWDDEVPMIQGIDPKVREKMDAVVFEPSFLTLKDRGC